MKKISAILFVLFAICTTTFSQTASFKERGYKGNVAYTNMFIVWNGFDTSHGYMFNKHHYLGVQAVMKFIRSCLTALGM